MKAPLNKEIETIELIIEPKPSMFYRYTSPEAHERWLRSEINDLEREVSNNRELSSNYVYIRECYEYTCPYCGFSYGNECPSVDDWQCCSEALDEVQK